MDRSGAQNAVPHLYVIAIAWSISVLVLIFVSMAGFVLLNMVVYFAATTFRFDLTRSVPAISGVRIFKAKLWEKAAWALGNVGFAALVAWALIHAHSSFLSVLRN